MSTNRFVSTVCALLLVTGGFGVTAAGCSKAAVGSGGAALQSQLASGTPDASSSVSATGSTNASGAPGGGSGTSRPKGLTNSDAKAIDAELTAIEKELDSLTLPGDSDLEGIESGLK